MSGSFTIGSVKIRIGADAKELQSDLNKAAGVLRKSAREFKQVGASLSQNVSLPLIGIGAAAIKVFGDLEALQKGLIAVMGSSEAAAREFEKLKEVAKLPGLGLEEAVQGSVRLQAAGFSADEARESLLQFGNALATVGKGKVELDFVVLALAQLQNKTTGFGQDLRQLTEQLPQLRTALKSAFGTSDSEAIAKLGVTGKEVVQILTQEFAKLPRVTGGLKNAFENLSDSTKIAFAKLGETINKTLNVEKLLTKLSDVITKIVDGFSNLSPQAQRVILAFAGIAAAIGPILFAIGVMSSGFSSLLPLIGKFAVGGLSGLSGVALAAGGLTIALGILILKWDDINEVMGEFLGTSKNAKGEFTALTDLVKGLGASLKFVVDITGNLIGTIVRLFQARATGLKKFAEDTKQAFKDTFLSFAENTSDGDVTLSEGRTNRGGAFNPNSVNVPDKPVTIKPPKTTPKTGKPENQFSPAITGGELLPTEILVTGIGGVTEAIETLNLSLGKTVTSMTSIKNTTAEVTDSMSSNFIKVASELEKAFNAAKAANEKILGGLDKASLLIGPALQFSQQLLDNQSVSIANKEAKEKAAIEATIKNEDVKAKRLAEIDKKYEKERKKIQIKQAIATKAAGIFQAIVSTFEGVARALALGPAGLPLIPFIKGFGLANVSAIAAAPLPSLAVGTDLVRRDGLANIHKGEAIVPAKVASGGFSGAGTNTVEVVGRVHGLDIVLSNKNSEDLYSRIYG